MDISAMTVLVCDDSLLIRKKMTTLLNNFGIKNVVEAIDGQDAVNKYKETNPNITFMDIVMPVKTGVEALSEIKEYDKNAKVIMASSVGTQKNLKDAIDAGAYDFFQKPVDDEQFTKLLESLSR